MVTNPTSCLVYAAVSIDVRRDLAVPTHHFKRLRIMHFWARLLRIVLQPHLPYTRFLCPNGGGRRRLRRLAPLELPTPLTVSRYVQAVGRWCMLRQEERCADHADQVAAYYSPDGQSEVR